MSGNVLTITQVNEYIRSKMDADGLLTNVAVKGEISNYKIYPSGHHYFTLKDENSSIPATMFGGAGKLKFKPENGMKVICCGRVSSYVKDGQYQLYAEEMLAYGMGDIALKFEQTKQKLENEGLFDPDSKRKIPEFPKKIAVITSSTGAAVRDIFNILERRWPLAEIIMCPVSVQGENAVPEMLKTLDTLYSVPDVDVAIIGRGGGSIEDLWAFNDERVAYAIYQSQIPVISAVGHEPDVTISDYVADLRAATPSNAAELAVPDRDALGQMLDSMSGAMVTALTRQIRSARQHLSVLSASPALKSPESYLNQKKKSLELLKNRLVSAQNQQIHRSNQRYIAAVSKLDAMSPLKVLSRGYAMAQIQDGEVLRSVKQVKPGDPIDIHVSDGRISAKVMNKEESE